MFNLLFFPFYWNDFPSNAFSVQLPVHATLLYICMFEDYSRRQHRARILSTTLSPWPTELSRADISLTCSQDDPEPWLLLSQGPASTSWRELGLAANYLSQLHDRLSWYEFLAFVARTCNVAFPALGCISRFFFWLAVHLKWPQDFASLMSSSRRTVKFVCWSAPTLTKRYSPTRSTHDPQCNLHLSLWLLVATLKVEVPLMCEYVDWCWVLTLTISSDYLGSLSPSHIPIHKTGNEALFGWNV